MGDNRFIIDGDGTITRTISDLDSIILNILRVGANKTNILAAYKARKNVTRFVKNFMEGLITKNMWRDCNCFMMDMLSETGDLKEQLELERFKGSRYYSFFANDSNCSYILVLNTDKKSLLKSLLI